MKRYLRQIIEDCNQQNCLNVFCRSLIDRSEAKKVAEILKLYGSCFLCSNLKLQIYINKRNKKHKLKADCSVFNEDFVENQPLNKNLIIDFYFYVIKMLYMNNLSIKDVPRKNKVKDNSDKENINNSFNFDDLSRSLEIECNDVFNDSDTINESLDSHVLYKKPYANLNHEYCEITERSINAVDAYLLVGVLELFLLKFHKEPNYNLAIIIIKVFKFLTSFINKNNDLYANIDESYFCIMNSVFDYLIDFLEDSKMKIITEKNETCKNCLFSFNMSNSDFETLFINFRNILENNLLTDVRVDPDLLFYFEIYKKIFIINQSQKIIDEESFVLNSFYARVNIKQELKFLRLNFNSCLNYNFCISVATKSIILKSYNSDLMRNTLQDAFFRALFEGVVEPYLYISVRREHIYLDTVNFFSKYVNIKSNDRRTIDDLQKQLKVRFIGEEGIDSGGIKKEFFLLLSHEIENDTKTFEILNNRLWFKKGVNLKVLNVIGKILAISLYNDVVLNISFPSVLFKKLLGFSLDINDLKEIEPEMFYSLKNLCKSTVEEFAFLDQYFNVEMKVNNNYQNYDLIANGSKIKVNVNNVEQFVNLYSLFILESFIEEEFESFKHGFYSIIDYEAIKSFKYLELENIIMGTDDYDFESLKINTTYNGYKIDDEIINWFWDLFFEMNLIKKKKLIQFITGNDRMPIGGSKTLNLIIMKNGCDTERLPSSQTCFNTFLLPEYSSKEKLRDKLQIAIEMTAGFFLL